MAQADEPNARLTRRIAQGPSPYAATTTSWCGASAGSRWAT